MDIQQKSKGEELNKLPQNYFSRMINSFVLKIANASVWVWPILIFVIILNVLMRYLFSEGRIELEELQWHLYAIGWLIGLSYCYIDNEHVRVDLFYDKFSIRTRCWIEMFGIFFLLLPFVLLVLIYAIPFISYSWVSSEISTAPGGLPYRWLIKSFIFISFSLLLLSMVSRLSQIFCFLFLKNKR